jgi:hypothetical protein
MVLAAVAVAEADSTMRVFLMLEEKAAAESDLLTLRLFVLITQQGLRSATARLPELPQAAQEQQELLAAAAAVAAE